ncbi:SET domain-containing protein, partial [Fistulina hepatica ATCC 64428]
LVFTTVPSQPLDLSKSTNEDGRTECILINPKIKRAIFTYPGFPDLVPRPRRKMYTIQDTSHMGLGMFAACDIKMGELILAERPLLFAPAFIIFGTSDSLPSHYTEEQTMQKMLVAWENEVSRAVSRMLPDDRAAYLALANCHKEDGSGPLFGIIQTNCFEVGDYRQDNNDHFGTHSAVCKDMSRANHSCCPNATRIFDPASFSMILSAACDIAKGDQIFVTYTDPVLPAEERAKNLAPFGVERCQCPACADSLASDRRR